MSTAIQTQLPTGTWTADPVHSEIGFGIEYMAGTFRGTVAAFSGEVEDDELRGSVDVSSVQVKDPNLETHLQSPEFFDAERHPQLTFRSERIERSGDEVSIDGELTIVPGIPTSCPAVTMPRASRTSCIPPAASLPAPDIICPVASSITDVVSSAPGRNVTSGAIRGG